jgi:hypothetical protein
VSENVVRYRKGINNDNLLVLGLGFDGRVLGLGLEGLGLGLGLGLEGSGPWPWP